MSVFLKRKTKGKRKSWGEREKSDDVLVVTDEVTTSAVSSRGGSITPLVPFAGKFMAHEGRPATLINLRLDPYLNDGSNA